MGSLWSLMTVLGPLLLAGVILWALLRNRKMSARDEAASESAARDLREQIDREDKSTTHMH